MSFQGNRGQVNKRFAGNLVSQAAKSRGRGRGTHIKDPAWIENNKDSKIPHYEDEPGWNRSQVDDGPEGGHYPRGRGRFMRWRGGRGNRGRGGGPLPCLGSSFVKEPLVPLLHSIPNIPLSVLNNQQQTYFNQQECDGPPTGAMNGGGPEWRQQNGAGGPGGPGGGVGFGPGQHPIQQQQPPASMQQHAPPQHMQQEPHQQQMQMHHHQMQQQQMHQLQQMPPHQQMPQHMQQQQHPQMMEQHQQHPPQQAGPPPSQRNAEQFLQSHQEMLTVATQAVRAINDSEVNQASAAQPTVSTQVSVAVTSVAASVAVTTTSLSTAPAAPMTEQERREKMAADAVAEIANKYNSTCDALRQPPNTAPEDRITVRQRKEAELQAAWDTLHQYWQFVQDNPYDFNGWTYLLSHVETMDNIDAARAAFDGFLPLYPYCFAYWRKISDMEAKHGSPERGLGILLEGVRCIPACTELWTAALQALTAYSKEHEHSKDVLESAMEECINSVGMSYRGVETWDYCIDYHTQQDNLPKVVQIYRELLNTPSKQYNKHWDRFLALVRDHHPRSLLNPEEYENLRQSCCKQLGLKYTPGPLVPPVNVKKTPQPEDKVSAAIKEKLVAGLVPVHEANEKAVNKRWKYEERIKRPYFHIKALDRRQIKNWNEYLELEIREGNPFRILMLFERCLVACAQYEDIWCKYAEYLEEHVRNVKAGIYDEQNKTENSSDQKNGKDSDDKNSDASKIKSNDKSESGSEVSAAGVSKGVDGETGTRKDSEQLSESCTGFARSAGDAASSDGRCVDGPESLVKKANKATDQTAEAVSSNGEVAGPDKDPVHKDASSASDNNTDSNNMNSEAVGVKDREQSSDSKSDGVGNGSDKDKSIKDSEVAVLDKDQIKSEPLDDDIVCINEDSDSNFTNSNQITDSASAYLRSVGGERSCWTYQDVRGYVSSGVGLVGRVLTCPPLTHNWVYQTVDWEDVRQVYRRAAWIHCPNKPLISMQWAYFEELQGNVSTARDLLGTVVAKHPTLLAARLAQVELEQRAGNFEHVEHLYRDAQTAVIAPRDRSFLAIKCARFLFKMRDNFDAALALLRKALKKDRCNVFLYQHVFDLCYERRPMDSRGVLAAVSLALQAKDLPMPDKCCFALKKIAFLREHGTLEQLREARQELKKHEKLLEQSIKEEKEKEEKENADKKKKEAEEKIKAAKEEVKKDEEKLTAAAAAVQQPPPSQEQQQQVAPQGPPQQQFPMPCFSADGVITYAPMEGYGYGVGASDTPPQQQGPPPAALQPPQQQRPPPASYNEQQQAGAPWQPHPDLSPEERERQQQNRQYEDMLRNRHMPGQGANQQGGPGPNQPVDNRGLMPRPPQGGPNIPPLMPPPPFPNLQSFSGPGNMGDPGNQQPGFKRPFPQEFRDGDGSEAKQARLDPSSRHQGNLTQFDPHYTEQSGPAAPPSHRATFGSYGDGPMPFGRPGGLRNFMRGGHNDQPMRGGPNDQPMRGGPNDQPMRGGPNDQPMRGGPNEQPMRGGPNEQPMRGGPNEQPMRGGPNEQPMRGGPNEQPMRGGPNDQPMRGGPNDQPMRAGLNESLPSNGGPGAGPHGGPNRGHNEGVLPPQGRHPNGLADFSGQSRPQGPPNDGPRGPFGPQNSAGPSEGQVIGPAGLQSLGVPRQLGLHEHSDTVNVPEWLVREGGELRLSATAAGNSVIRYWPSYMTVEGSQKMFEVIRENTKWHQRRMLIDNEGVNVPHLLSWVGPCDYSYRGMTLYKNDSWRPEIVDLLHRLMQYTSTQYNSCYLSLYRNGSDQSAWACHDHPALRERPVVAIVSLGQTRHFEMQRKDGRGFLRFPLFSGSLLLMEGATQDDWIQQVPKQPLAGGERMELTFRKMFMIKGLTV